MRIRGPLDTYLTEDVYVIRTTKLEPAGHNPTRFYPLVTSASLSWSVVKDKKRRHDSHDINNKILGMKNPSRIKL